MATFTTRVQLNGDESAATYGRLHQAMEERNFSRTITSNDGVVYQLPHAEYNLVGSYTRDDVLSRAQEAIESIGQTGRILITESAGRRWSGLSRS